MNTKRFRNKISPYLWLFQVRHKFYGFLEESQKLYHRLFAVILLLALSNTLMIWLLGRPFGYLASENYAQLVQVLAALFFVVVVNQVLHYFNTYYANVLGLEYVGRLRTHLMRQYVHSPQLVTDDVAKGDLLSRLSHDVDTIQRFIVELPLFLSSHIFTIVLYAGMLLYINWQLAMIAIFLTPVFFIHQKFFATKKRYAAEKFFMENGRLLAKEDEILTNLSLVNAFNSQQEVAKQHKHAFYRALQWAKKERQLDAIFSTTLSVVIYFCALFIVYQGVDNVQSGNLTIAELVSFLLYMGYLSIPLRGITQLMFQARSDAMAGERLGPFLADSVSTADKNKKELIVTKGEIVFDQVTLSISGTVILDKISFYIEPGKTVAIVGNSGAGKSTIANLLLGFITPDSGTIEIDQQDLSHCTLESIRNNLGMVWQSPMLFNDTIKNNLLLANSTATDEMMISALKDADAWDFVSQLSDGINTLIGTGGVLLSAGQKQRVHIAQAFLRDSMILIMDEASSALDSESEKRLVTNIKRVRKGRTTLLIAHRYSSLRYADYVIYLNTDGSVITGTHDELLRSHPDYKQALNWQSVVS